MQANELHPTAQALVRAVRAEFERVLDDIGPIMDRRPEPQFRDPEVRNVQAAQNALRTCLEAIYERMLPYGFTTPIELAIRLASYALSVLPAEHQNEALETFIRSFPTAHRRRIREGTRLEAGWITEGRERSNFPKGDS